jgi:hypothetical protein
VQAHTSSLFSSSSPFSSACVGVFPSIPFLAARCLPALLSLLSLGLPCLALARLSLAWLSLAWLSLAWLALLCQLRWFTFLTSSSSPLLACIIMACHHHYHCLRNPLPLHARVGGEDVVVVLMRGPSFPQFLVLSPRAGVFLSSSHDGFFPKGQVAVQKTLVTYTCLSESSQSITSVLSVNGESRN